MEWAVTLDQFWRQADAIKRQTELRVEAKMGQLRAMPIGDLREVLVQYRFFTIYYIGDLALLLARMPFGKLRSFLGQVLSEELGDGSPDRSHPALYDSFLSSIGVSSKALSKAIPENLEMLDALRAQLTRSTVPFGIGLRGMGGECLCQTYLTCLHDHFRSNAEIQSRGHQIDWRFWDIHIGEIDLAHVEQTKSAISEAITGDPDMVAELQEGYRQSIQAWDSFWDNIFFGKAPQEVI